jgi:hypothetical protein
MRDLRVTLLQDAAVLLDDVGLWVFLMCWSIHCGKGCHRDPSVRVTAHGPQCIAVSSPFLFHLHHLLLRTGPIQEPSFFRHPLFASAEFRAYQDAVRAGMSGHVPSYQDQIKEVLPAFSNGFAHVSGRLAVLAEQVDALPGLIERHVENKMQSTSSSSRQSDVGRVGWVNCAFFEEIMFRLTVYTHRHAYISLQHRL